ncbi:methylmalonyl-CoA mutase [Membranicola marinus]|uniref:methylmalonyl-CoA mutase n=1 Tax=Membranihabitans marinus TaxID=1227546 RepID=A0A953L737_9BACT|nr:methylmalonyl-CoA mutase [Membranihabitans marinus]MBY5958317.1 methylmalonyl-CoA mutase [Membranihabitans marinus]
MSNENSKWEIGQAGLPPFTRGPYASMYVGRPWTIRQYAGFSTAEESNAFYRANLKAGQKGLSVAFDLPTHRGYDSDHNLVSGDVGKAGVAIDSVEDMKVLFDAIPLDKMSVSMTMNGAVIPVMAFYIVAAEEQGVSLDKLTGTIQNDILKEFLVRNTYIYPPEPSMRIVSDIMAYTGKYMPRFNSISVSGYHMHEAGAPAALEVGYTIADGVEYVRAGLRAGLEVDDFVPRMSFFWGIGTSFYVEIAKLRAARKLWSDQMADFQPAKSTSQRLRAHSQTSGWSLTAQQPINNLTRTTMEAMAALFGGTQSLHTNSYDEALALPSDHSAKLARDTQLYLRDRSAVTQAIDPWAGSEYIENLTKKIYCEALSYVKDIESMGGMTEAIKSGVPKQKIEEAAAKRQADIELGHFEMVGVNVLTQSNKTKAPEVRLIDNQKVLGDQQRKLDTVKKQRNKKQVSDALTALRKGAKNGNNLLELAVEAARSRATLGEISYTLEEVFGRYQARSGLIQHIYGSQMSSNDQYKLAQQKCAAFEEQEGRRPRILIAKLGQDGHDRGARMIASSFADIGFDVDIGPLFLTPEDAARQAIENDVHFLGVSSLAGAHDTLVPETIKSLNRLGGDDIKVVVGGVIPEQDYESLYQAGVYYIFGPGTPVTTSALHLLEEYIK